MESPYSNADFSRLFRNLKRAAAEMWAIFLDGCTTSFEEPKSRDFDAAKYFKDIRSSLKGLRGFEKTVRIRIKRFEGNVSQSAMNYGLNLIPDEMLSHIFVFATEPDPRQLQSRYFSELSSLRRKVALSLACRRFRTVMMSTRKMWDGHYLKIGQAPEEMVAIAEGNRFVSLKVVIHGRGAIVSSKAYEAWTRKRGLDPEKFIDLFYKRSLDFILPLHLEELLIYLREGEEEAQRILDSVAMRSVRSLNLRNCPNSVLRSFERRHTPSLQNLCVDFVPGPAVGRGLISFISEDLRNDELDSLREFLASANSLQYLLLFFRDHENPRFNEACDLPSLRSLVVNFIPHPSFARHLTRFAIELCNEKPYEHVTLTLLTELLDFLSSTEALQVLSIYHGRMKDYRHNGEAPWANLLRAVSLPCLVSCEIHHGHFDLDYVPPAVFLIGKLRMPVLRRLKLRFASHVVYDLNDRKRLEGFDPLPPPPDAFTILHERRISFEDCGGLTPDIVNRITVYLPDTEGMQIEFHGMARWRHGTFKLDELDFAWLPPPFSSSDDSSSI